MFQRVRDLWSQHGTKLIGFGSTVLGVVSLIDASTLHVIDELFGPHWGHRVSSGLMVVGGIGTAWRGYTNSKAR